MSEDTGTGSLGNASGVPAIRTFQLDSTSSGQLASAVNLFRGDVNIPQSLFTLPGRQAGDGMDVTLTIFYQSNVFRGATLWNRDAPTGALGLGWDLPLTYIDAAASGSPDPQARTYVLYDNGTPNELVRQPQAQVLFAIPIAVAGGLVAGRPVTAGLRTCFLENGLTLDPASVVSGDADAWAVADDVLQQQFSIQPSATDPATCSVCFGGQAYQLQSYSFWQIVYFPAYERWLVVTDDGLRKSFGGAGPNTAQGYRTAAGNSIAWGVWWGAGGAPVWSGPSGATTGQQQVACGWYLESTSNIFGDRVSYAYNGWPRAPTGLLPEVEQQVGVGGLPYTKQVYLTAITDVFGRTATLSYGEKVWNADGPREYADPHRDVPSNAPNAYQDRYDTKFLSGIAVASADGAALFGVELHYVPSPSATGPEQALANVTTTTGVGSYDVYKRYLTAVTITNALGDSLPGYGYGYCLSPAQDGGAQPGALQTITSPQGGTVSYGYAQQNLTVCDRTQPVQRPAQTPNGRASVFYGDDYAVSLWCDSQAGCLTLQVYTWYGRWISWQLDAGSPVLYTGTIQDATLDVVANGNFFVVSFATGSSSLAWVFSKDAARPGQFLPATVGSTVTGVDAPTLSYPSTAGTVSYAGGDTFFAVAVMEQNSSSYSYDVLTWRWTTQSWQQETYSPTQYTWLAAAGEYLLTLDWSGNVTLGHLDGALDWNTSAPSVIEGFSVPGEKDANVALSSDTGTVVVNLLTAGNALQHSYQLYIIQWDADHVLLPATGHEVLSEPQPPNGQLPWQPVIVDNSLVAVNGTILRFDGSAWLANASMTGSARPPATPRFAYGPDYALMAVGANNENLVESFNVLGYDPDADPASWAGAQAASYRLPAAAQYPYDNWPAAGNADYATVGDQLYFRGTATDWTAVPGQSTAFTVGGGAGYDFESQSLVNEGPGFLAFCSFPTSGGQSPLAQAIVLQNGQPGATVTISTQRMYTPSLEGVGGPGSSPQGPSMFVSYDGAASSFTQATEVYLNRYAGDALLGPVVHWPVTSVTVDDGYDEPVLTTYDPDPASAACDPTGLVVKYYKNTVYPGSPTTSPVFGSSEATYVNGLDAGGADYYDMLDGLLSSTTVFDNDGNVLESSQSSWSVVQVVASDPTDPAAAPIQLRGGWVQQDTQSSTSDGVSSVRTNAFTAPGMPGPFSGCPVTVTRTSFDAGGSEQTFVRSSTYGPETSAAMRALNMRSSVVQTTTRVQTGPDTSLVISASASPFLLWPSAAGDGVLVPAVEGRFRLIGDEGPAFPFASYAAGQTPTGWIADRRVTARTQAGQPAEWVDASGTATSAIFSADLAFPVADVSNAPLGASAYLGFEPYEDTSPWQLENTSLQTDDVRTGTTGLLLAAGTGAALSVTLPAAAGTYVVGCWCKTPAGASGDGALTCAIVAGGSPATAVVIPAHEAWTLETIGVPLPDGGPASLIVTVSNASDADVVLDSVYVVPLAGGMIARTFDPASRLVTSAADAGGRTRWSVHDAFWRRTLEIGPDAQPTELALRFLSRQGSAAGAFELASPNAELTLHPAVGGSVETFTDGGAWASTWQPSDPAAWSASAAGLAHVATGDATLSYLGALPPTWAVYFEVAAGEGPPSLALQAGAVSVTYTAAGYAGWATAMTPLAEPPQMARHWLLVAGDGVVLFFGDGQLLFSAEAAGAVAAPVITTGADLTLSHLSFLSGPRLSLAYNDGGGRQRQAHRLSGADSRVCEIVYDALDRPVATTRVASGSFGTGAGLPVLAYRPGFVDTGAFLASLVSTCVMTGDVADYYRGQTVDGIQRSDDAGYPYRATRWEASPRKRTVELGLPGLPYAIHDVDSTTPAERATTQFAYAANDGHVPPLPAGEYAQTTLTTPVKIAATRLSDKLGQSVSSVQSSADTAAAAQSAALRSYVAGPSGPQTSLDLQLPNALVPGPQTGDAAYVVTTITDGANRALVTDEANSGETQFLYDGCGRVRFVQAAIADGDEPSFSYTRYDAIGRVVEQGTVDMAWEPVTLAGLAAQPDWPTADVAHTVSLILSYDGDGNDATLIGKKVACTTTTPPPDGGVACVVNETFSYDASGRVTGLALTVAGPSSAAAATGYGYNNLGEVVSVTYPQGSPLAAVAYTLDDQGWITAVGSEESPSSISAYSYTPDGAIERETLGNGDWVRTITYASPGWALRVATAAPDGQSFTLSNTYNADGTIATRSVDYAFTTLNATLADSYTYDGQGRLETADGSSDDQVTSYDPNGNILAATVGGDQQTFSQAAGTDQLEQVTIGGARTDVVYDARGRVTSALGRTLSYDDATNLTVAASLASNTVQFGYSSRRERVLRQVTGPDASTTVYVNGPGGMPIARLDGATWTALVHGPSGVAAACSLDETLYPLKDHQQTVWAVVGPTGLAARYVYLPFGDIVTADGPQPNALPYAYMGQEWDATLSLYDFRDRLYDPVLRRYLAPDAARQFPSPYLFCANNPLSVTDPSGDIALWAQIGIGVTMGLIAVAGIAATIATAGAAAPAVAAGEAALGVAEAGAVAAGVGSAAAEAAAEGGAVAGAAAVESGAAAGAAGAEGGAAAAEGGAAAASEVAAGAGSGAASGAATAGAASSTVAANLGNLALNTGIGIVEGFGLSGMQYDIQNGRTFTASGFFEAAGWGALSGAIGGSLGAIPGMPFLSGWMDSLPKIAQFGVNVAAQGVSGVVASDVTQILTNVTATGPGRPPWYGGLLKSTLIAGGESVGIAAFTSGVTLGSQSLKTIGNQTVDNVSSAVDRLQAAAKTNDGKMCIGTAAFFATAGVAVTGSWLLTRGSQSGQG